MTVFRCAVRAIGLLWCLASVCCCQVVTSGYTRSVIGFEQTGASSADSKQKFFFDVFVNRPLRRSDKPSWFYWSDVRISSVPQQINDAALQFAGNFAQNVGSLKVNELAQSGEFLAGFEWRPAAGHVGLIAGLGGVGILNPNETLNLFEVPASGSRERSIFDNRFKNLSPPVPSTATNFGFPAADRDRYFRQWVVGTRFTFDGDVPAGSAAPPFTVDLTLGQNESVTGGRLHGGVLRADGFYPLALMKGEHPPLVFLFGTVLFGLSRALELDPLVLKPSASSVTPYESSVALITRSTSNRDSYRIGIGLDVISIYCKLKPDSCH